MGKAKKNRSETQTTTATESATLKARKSETVGIVTKQAKVAKLSVVSTVNVVPATQQKTSEVVKDSSRPDEVMTSTTTIPLESRLENTVADVKEKKKKRMKREHSAFAGSALHVSTETDKPTQELVPVGNNDILSQRKERSWGKKKKRKQGEESAGKSETCDSKKSSSSSRDCALQYLQNWKHQPDSWSFQKVRQVWLLKHMYDTTQVSEKDFQLLLEYLEKLTGKARQATIDTAEKMLSDSEEMEANPTVDAGNAKGVLLNDDQVDRIRQVLQMLS
jgi:hypothetical protein